MARAPGVWFLPHTHPSTDAGLRHINLNPETMGEIFSPQLTPLAKCNPSSSPIKTGPTALAEEMDGGCGWALVGRTLGRSLGGCLIISHLLSPSSSPSPSSEVRAVAKPQ